MEIRYDYEGVEKWVTGVWRAKTLLTSKYAAHMQEAGKKVKISFCKIAAHTGNHYNEEADQLAKSALLKMDEEVQNIKNTLSLERLISKGMKNLCG